MKRQVPNKRKTYQRPDEKQTAARIQKKLDRPNPIPKPNQRTKWAGRGSPKTTWGREGRDPTRAKDREELMRIFNRNVEKESFSKTEFREKVYDRLDHKWPNYKSETSTRAYHPGESNYPREARWDKAYHATGLGDTSKAIRLEPIGLSGKTQEDYIAAVKGTDRYKEAGFNDRFDKSPLLDHGESYRASSVPRRVIIGMRPGLAINFPDTVYLDHTRDKSLDTPAVKREMAHYDKLHSALQKRDKAVSSLSNMFFSGMLRRR